MPDMPPIPILEELHRLAKQLSPEDEPALVFPGVTIEA
jgi:hypothetical protein